MHLLCIEDEMSDSIYNNIMLHSPLHIPQKVTLRHPLQCGMLRSLCSKDISIIRKLYALTSSPQNFIVTDLKNEVNSYRSDSKERCFKNINS